MNWTRKKEIFSEDERTLIEEYALQFRDMNRSRELAERICYQEEYGNQDVAPVVIEARREIQEKKRGTFAAEKEVTLILDKRKEVRKTNVKTIKKRNTYTTDRTDLQSPALYSGHHTHLPDCGKWNL